MVGSVQNSPVDDLFMLDSRFLGHRGHVAVYLLNAVKPILLDTAASTCTSTVLSAFDEVPLTPADVKFVFVSHLHLDHAGGAGYLLDEFENATVLVHERGRPFLTEAERMNDLVESAHRATGKLADGYGDMKRIPPDRVRTLHDGDEIDLGDRSVEVIEAPGHAGHQLALFEPDTGWLYPGDEAGLWIDDRTIPATPPPDFDLKPTLDSLARFGSREPNYLVYPHYGVCDDPLATLENYETVLRQWVRTVQDTREREENSESVVEAMVGSNSFYPDLWDERTRRQVIETDTMGVLRYLNQGE